MRVSTLFALAGLGCAQKFPNIPLDWSAFQDEVLIQNQGSFFQGSDVCCSLESPDCQVQVQNQAGQFYFGFSANATAQVFGDGSSIVSLYNPVGGWEFGVEMEVAPNMTCLEYCPNEFPLQPYNVVNYTDLGQTMINGAAAEHWQQVDCLTEHCYLNISIQVDNQYINQTDFNNAFPIVDVLYLTPFNEYLGTVNTTFTNWISGPPPSQYFNVSGVNTCPQSNSCNSVSRQLMRLGAHQLKAYRHWAKVTREQAERKAAADAAARAAGRAVDHRFF